MACIVGKVIMPEKASLKKNGKGVHDGARGKKQMRPERESGSNYVAVFYDTVILTFVLSETENFQRIWPEFHCSAHSYLPQWDNLDIYIFKKDYKLF